MTESTCSPKPKIFIIQSITEESLLTTVLKDLGKEKTEFTEIRDTMEVRKSMIPEVSLALPSTNALLHREGF